MPPQFLKEDNNNETIEKDSKYEIKDIYLSKEDTSESDYNTEPAPPTLIDSLSKEKKKIYSNNICECFEMDKLLLTHCCFKYNNKIKKNDFYKVTYEGEIEFNNKIIKARIENNYNYDKFINNYHYNAVNLIEYSNEVLKQINNRFKYNINFELKLKFINEKINGEFFPIKNDKFYHFHINCHYKFIYFDENDEIIDKKKYKLKNIFEEDRPLLKISDIFAENEKIWKKIDSKTNDNRIIKVKMPINAEEKKIKINKIKRIFETKKVIKKHTDSVQMIKEFPCGNFVSCGLDGQLVLYDENMEVINYVNIENWIYSISEIPDTQNEFMACCPEKIFLVTIKDNELHIQNKRLNLKNSLNKYSFSTKEDETILCGNNSVTQYKGYIKDIQKENNDIYVLNSLPATCGKKITKNIIAVVSNKVYKNGQDILKIINTNNKNELKQIEYSFNTNPNSLLIIDTNIKIKSSNSVNSEGGNKKKKRNKNKNKNKSNVHNNATENAKLLFCACTKYFEEQKNGIFIMCPNINAKRIQDEFYDTGDFEVFCFCLLIKSANEEKGENDENGKNDVDKHFLLVGGYDNNFNKGLVKIFEIIYDTDDKIELTKLKFRRNVYNLSNSKQPINCIIQSSKTGEIIVTSWDGSVKLFNKPNLDILINNN